jgi:hypothetical protein
MREEGDEEGALCLQLAFKSFLDVARFSQVPHLAAKKSGRLSRGLCLASLHTASLP